MTARIHRATAASRRSRARGFTLIEVLVSIAILTIIVAIVYASFDAVANVTEHARESAEEMRRRQFLGRVFASSFSTVYIDMACFDERLQFVGASETGPHGAMDSVDFCSSAPLMGGMAMPGILKLVHYGGTSDNDSDMTLDSFDDADEGAAPATLSGSETLLIAQGGQDMGLDDMASLGDAAGYDSPSWSVPVRSFDAAYFNGEDWVEEWDSLAEGRLPWGVRIRVDFAQDEDDDSFLGGDDSDEVADFETIIPIPLGAGVWTPAEEWLAMAGVAAQGGEEDEAGEDEDGGGGATRGNRKTPR